MALPPRESVYGCIDRLITAREIAESAEVSGHSILSSDELASTIARLTDQAEQLLTATVSTLLQDVSDSSLDT
jgi:hypothetical protein